MKYSVYGSIRLDSEKRNFVKTVEAKTENDAKEKVLSMFGSANGLPRSKIKIERIESTT